jgi:hypothetical protein
MINRITNIPIPEILYKYRDWRNKYHRNIITKQEIYFSKPSEFNDPFDGNIPVRWDLMTYEECLEKNLEILNIVHKNKNQKQVREYAKKITDEKTLWTPDLLSKETPEQLKKWNSIIGLFSLSAVSDNILMWSHYSFNHTGFVIGFKTNSLSKYYDFDYIEPIIYQHAYPVISGKDDITTQFYKKFFYKSNLWNYENEWRISKNHIANRIIKLKRESINHIIIGCCSDRKDDKQMIKLCKKHLGSDFPIYKAKKDQGNFGLIINQIE